MSPPPGGHNGGEQRAMAFATEETYLRAMDGPAAKPTRAVLTFVVGGETYGVDILHIREIIKMRDITEVPRMPAFLLGVISVRGLVIPVIDLRARLRLDDTPLTRAARILVVDRDGEPFGLLCDAVTGVVRFTEAEIEPPPSTLAVADTSFLNGIGRYFSGKRQRMVILLHLDAVVEFEIRRRKHKDAERAT
jgi:purine-binding chemotaxis protein CheW